MKKVLACRDLNPLPLTSSRKRHYTTAQGITEIDKKRFEVIRLQMCTITRKVNLEVSTLFAFKLSALHQYSNMCLMV